MTAGQVLSAIKVDVVRQPVQTVPNVLELLKSRPRSSVRVCLFGRPKPDETKKVYDDFLVSNRQYAINRYGFDVETEKFIEQNLQKKPIELNTDSSSSTNIIITSASDKKVENEEEAVHQRLHGDTINYEKEIILSNVDESASKVITSATTTDTKTAINIVSSGDSCDVNNRLKISDAISEEAAEKQQECNHSEIVIKAIATVATTNYNGKSKHDIKPYDKPTNKSNQITGNLLMLLNYN